MAFCAQEGSWGAPAKKGALDGDDWLTGKPKVEAKVNLDPEQEAWNKKKEEERKQQAAETEARMQKWMAEAAAKKAAEGK